ncbi:hypothetical protein U1Q18_036462, partial [Sarracenia purpurea var. burkii]
MFQVRSKVGKRENEDVAEDSDSQVSPALFPDLDCVGSNILKKEAISAGDGVQVAAIKVISSQARQVFVEMPGFMPVVPGAGADAVVAGESSQGVVKEATVRDRENKVLDSVVGAAIPVPNSTMSGTLEPAEGFKAPASWANVVAAN